MKIVALAKATDHFALMYAIEGNLRYRAERKEGWSASAVAMEDTMRRLNEFRDAILPLNVRLTLHYTNRLIEEIKKGFQPDGSCVRDLGGVIHTHAQVVGITNSFGKELEGLTFLMLEDSENELIDAGAQLWDAPFASQFPSALDDLDEAAKCLAFGRSTAAVLHLMRIVEYGLRALHAHLGITVVLEGNERNWGNILRRIKSNIDSRPASGKKDSLQAKYAMLNAVKDAWRNPSMHIGHKHTPEDADRIHGAVKSFMLTLSDVMDENGDPKA
jgi:hypothetical protein